MPTPRRIFVVAGPFGRVQGAPQALRRTILTVGHTPVVLDAIRHRSFDVDEHRDEKLDLLVEYAIVARSQRGMARLEAVLDACHKRARPIVMTTLAMGAGMLPNALGLGAEPSFRQPMAIVVIGGLLTSTVLCLLVVPVVFTYVDDFLVFSKRWMRRLSSHEVPTLSPARS